MADKDLQETKANQSGRAGFLNKAEQISRIYHNIMDGSFKLVIMIGIVVAIVIAAGVYSNTVSGFDRAKTWACEYLNPFCDTESEIREQKEKEQKEKAQAEQTKKDERREIAAETPSVTEKDEDSADSDEAGMLKRGWGAVKGWFSDGDQDKASEPVE